MSTLGELLVSYIPLTASHLSLRDLRRMQRPVGFLGGGNSVPARPERARERCEGCSQAGTTVGSGTVMHDAQAAGQTG